MEIFYPPEIYKYFDNLIFKDYEFAFDVRNIREKFDIAKNYDNLIFWVLDEYDISQLSENDFKLYKEFHTDIGRLIKKFFIPKIFHDRIREYVIMGNTDLVSHSHIDFSNSGIIKITIPINFSKEKWDETWEYLQKTKIEKLDGKRYKLDEMFTLKRKLFSESIGDETHFSDNERKILLKLDESNKRKRIKDYEKYLIILKNYSDKNI